MILVTTFPRVQKKYKKSNDQIGMTFSEDIHVPQGMTSFNFGPFMSFTPTEKKAYLYSTFGIWQVKRDINWDSCLLSQCFSGCCGLE